MLAAHHARFWNGVGLENADFIPRIDGPRDPQSLYKASLPGFKHVFGDRLTPEMNALADAFSAAIPGLRAALGQMPTTLMQGDYRADNLFFDDDGSVAVIDWQAITEGGGAADVGYFLSQNLSTEARRANEDTLLHVYHEGLIAGGVTDYDFDTFFDDYRLGVMYGWLIPVFAVGSLDVSSERAMSLFRIMIDRLQATIADHNAGEFLQS